MLRDESIPPLDTSMPRPCSSSKAPAASSTTDRARASSASSAAICLSLVGGAWRRHRLDLDDDVVVAGGPQGRAPARARRAAPPREPRRAVAALEHLGRAWLAPMVTAGHTAPQVTRQVDVSFVGQYAEVGRIAQI